MNTCTLVGRVYKWPADMRTIQGSGTRFLSCMVAYEKKFPNGKRFTEKFKILMFGKNAETICPQLKAGTLVVVTGEVGLDNPKNDEGRPMLKIVGNISLIEVDESPNTPPPRPNKPPAANDAPPEEEEDIPF